MLEYACHELDLLLAEEGDGESHAGTSFGKYTNALRELSEKKRLCELTDKVRNDAVQLISNLVIRLPDAENNLQLKSVNEWIATQQEKSDSLVILHHVTNVILVYMHTLCTILL